MSLSLSEDIQSLSLMAAFLKILQSQGDSYLVKVEESYKPVLSTNSWWSMPYFSVIIPSCAVHRELDREQTLLAHHKSVEYKQKILD